MAEELLKAIIELSELRERLIALYEEVFVDTEVSEREALLSERVEAIMDLQAEVVAQEKVIRVIRKS